MNPLRSITVYPSIAVLEAQPGMDLPRYAMPLDRPVVYKWIPENADTTNSVKTLGSVGGHIGTWQEVRLPDLGEDLDDEDADIGVSGDVWRRLPDATLSANRVATLITDGAAAGDRLEFTLLDDGAYSYTLENDGTGGGNVLVKPAGEAWHCIAYFDGTDWLLRSASQLP
jgi:hypothetical protein